MPDPHPSRGSPQVDGTSSKVLMMRFVVTAYPSIFMLREGKTYHYEGHRDVSSVRGQCMCAA